MSLTTIVRTLSLTALLLPTLAHAEEKPEKSIYELAYPDERETIELTNGATIQRQAALFCYDRFYNDFTTLDFARVFYTEEVHRKKDAWGAYNQTLQQLIVEYRTPDGATYDVLFITDPHADGIGLTDREGSQVLKITKTTEAGSAVITDNNKFVWKFPDGFSYGFAAEKNRWDADALLPQVEQIMHYLRARAAHAHRVLRREYLIDFVPDRTPNPDSNVMSQKQILRLYAQIQDLEQHAEKIIARKEH